MCSDQSPTCGSAHRRCRLQVSAVTSAPVRRWMVAVAVSTMSPPVGRSIARPEVRTPCGTTEMATNNSPISAPATPAAAAKKSWEPSMAILVSR